MDIALPTVRIEDDGFPDGLVINESDFDANTHVRFGEEPKRSKKAAAQGGTIAEQLAALSYKDLQALARTVDGVAFMQSKDALVTALAPHVEGGSLELPKA